MSRIVLCLSGGIASYNACELLRRMQGAGHLVTFVPIAESLEFVGLRTCGALSCRPLKTSFFDDAHILPHFRVNNAFIATPTT